MIGNVACGVRHLHQGCVRHSSIKNFNVAPQVNGDDGLPESALLLPRAWSPGGHGEETPEHKTGRVRPSPYREMGSLPQSPLELLPGSTCLLRVGLECASPDRQANRA